MSCYPIHGGMKGPVVQVSNSFCVIMINGQTAYSTLPPPAAPMAFLILGVSRA